MNIHRLRYYLAQIGCDDERISAKRSPNEHCDDALATVGFSPGQIAQIDCTRRVQRARVVGGSAILLTVNAVGFGLAVHRFERALSDLSLIIDNWDNIVLAYSVADALGWDTTAEIMIVTARAVIPFGTFLLENSEEAQHAADVLGYGAEIAAIKADLADALITGGLSIALSFAAWGLVKWWNSEIGMQLREVEERTRPVQQLHILLASGAPPQAVRKQLPQVPKIVAAVGPSTIG